MPLKAKKPEAVEKRLKMFVFGPPAVGKTTAIIQFPNSYIIDTERGSDFYSESINKAGSVVLQTNNPDDIKAEIKALLTEKHQYKTLVIDPITQLYNGLQDKWTRIFEKHTEGKTAELQDFGMRYWGRVKGEYKSIQRLLTPLDMNVIITSHQKDLYGPNMSKIGVGPDSMKGDDYFFDLVFQLTNVNGKRVAITIKERAEIGKNKFPPEFEWSYENFLKYYGADVIQRAAVPVVMASAEQIAEIKHLLGTVNIEDAEVNKWLAKADVDSFEEMNSETIDKCIQFVRKKLEPVKAGK